LRHIAKPKLKSDRVTALSEASAKRALAAWQRAHPRAKIVKQEAITGEGVSGSDNEGSVMVTILFDYEE